MLIVTSSPVPSRLLSHRAYRRVLIAATGSKLGTAVSSLAIPLVAVLALRASPGQVGLLATLSTASFVLIGLPAGAWIDRMSKRPVMVAADLARCLLLASIPLAWALHVLTIFQLYAVVLAVGSCTVFFDVASLSFLPHVVGRDHLPAANSQLVAVDAAVQIGGRGVGGFLIALVSAPWAVVVDSASYLWSASFLIRAHHPEPQPARGFRRENSLRREIADGLAFVFTHRMLRPIALSGSLVNLAIQICQTLLPVEFVRLGLGASAIGLFFAVGGVGSLLGSLAARPLAARFGAGRVLWLAGLAVTPAGVLVALVDRGPALWLTAAAWLLTTFKTGLDNVIKVSFRQSVTPIHLLGRMNGTMRFLLTGALSVGAALAGLLGGLISVRAGLWCGAGVLAVVWVPICFSPLRTTRDLPR